jgi:hypothetical protein
MKNHYYTYYHGNKRKEIKDILPLINLENITTIIEPFAGSAAMSYYISTLYPNKFKYILNDNDKINYDLFNISRDTERTEDFNNNINKIIDQFNTYTDDIPRKAFYNSIDKMTLEGYIFTFKYCCIRKGLYPLITRTKQIKPFKIQEFPIYHFYNNEDVTYTNIDGVEMIQNNYDDETSNLKLFLVDPPYLKTSKGFGFYNNLNMDIYDWILEYEELLLNNKNKFIFILEHIEEIDKLFSNFKTLNVYDKKYEMSKKRITKHIIYSN